MSAPKSLDELAMEAICFTGWCGNDGVLCGNCKHLRPAVLAALKQAVEQEREACAVVVDDSIQYADDRRERVFVEGIAKRIRARHPEDR